MLSLPLIKFVPPGCDDDKQDEKPKKTTETQSNASEIKHFYDTLIASNSSRVQSNCTQINQRDDHLILAQKQNEKQLKCDGNQVNDGQKKTTKSNIKKEHIFTFCQNGDKQKVMNWLEMGFDINECDPWSWSPLMCASFAGHQHLVELLLNNGADIRLCDKTGRNAFDLALINGHMDVMQILINHKKSASRKHVKHKKSKLNDDEKSKKYPNDDLKANDNRSDSNRVQNKSDHEESARLKYCCVCHLNYTHEKQHQCSIVHQLNTNEYKVNDNHFISEKSKGYYMMARHGWDKSEGLGPKGLGRKIPIKTVLKRDRLGFGNTHSEAKVTHFRSYDVKAVRNESKIHLNSRKTRLKEIKERQRRETRIEINFRSQFRD